MKEKISNEIYLHGKGLSNPFEQDNPELVECKRQSTCRLCGEKITKGSACFQYFASFGDGGSYNPWKALLVKSHTMCMLKEYPETTITNNKLKRRF